MKRNRIALKCTKKWEMSKLSEFTSFRKTICFNLIFPFIPNPFSSNNGIPISQIFKNVSFEMSVFDQAEWYPIDEKIVTELHHKLQILPCAFPHAEYLRENYVKYPIGEQIKSTKTVKTPSKFRKICPANDAYIIRKKLEIIKSKRKEQTKQSKRISKAKKLKKATRRAEKAKAENARKIETKEFESTKKLLIDTMDQYNTLTGQSLNGTPVKIATADDGSIAGRTRNRTKISTPEKATRPNRKRNR